MKQIIVSSLILSFCLPIAVCAEEFAELRRDLSERLPDVAIGEIRRLPNTPLIEVQVNGMNLFYTDANGEIWLQDTSGMVFSSGRLVSGVVPKTEIEGLLAAVPNS